MGGFRDTPIAFSWRAHVEGGSDCCLHLQIAFVLKLIPLLPFTMLTNFILFENSILSHATQGRLCALKPH